jgi:hypothetical protein
MGAYWREGFVKEGGLFERRLYKTVYLVFLGAHLLRWSFNYSCWQLFLLELDTFLQYMPHNSGILKREPAIISHNEVLF